MENNYSMKWFKFLIYFALFAGALLNLSYGVQFMSGMIYVTQGGLEKEAVELFYALVPDMKSLDMVYGVVSIVIAALMLITRFALAGYKKIGPALLIGVYVLSFIASIIYVVAGSSILNVEVSEVMNGSTSTSLLISVVMIIANIIYFKKRKELFAN